MASPGTTADSDGLFHGMGDHASNSFSVDGQKITDQQSKVFSNQIPLDSVQSMEVIQGAPPAEYGDKTSLVIVVTTRSAWERINLTARSPFVRHLRHRQRRLQFGVRREVWGNFISASGLDTGRFLDGPEFQVMHDKGNLGIFSTASISSPPSPTPST
ncbi:MAG: TonB-dependent receptor plug domain-containing protein [Ignavibacteriota bacterium]